MTDKASGTDSSREENPTQMDPNEPGIPAGEELNLEPDGGEMLDPTNDRWWEESKDEPRAENKNRRIEPGEAKAGDEEAEVTIEEKAEPEVVEDLEEEKLEPAPEEAKSEAEPSAAAAEASSNSDPSAPPLPSPLIKKSFRPVDLREVQSKEPEAIRIGETIAHEAEEVSASSHQEVEEIEPEEVIAEPVAELKIEEVKNSPPELPKAAEEPQEETSLDSDEPVPKKPKKKKKKKKSKKKKENAPARVTAVVPDAETKQDVEAPAEAEKPASEKTEEPPLKNSLAPSPKAVPLKKPTVGSVAAASTVVSAAPAGAGVEKKKKGGCWATFTTLFFFAALLLVGALAVGAFLGYKKIDDAEAQITGRVIEKLEARGIFPEYSGWSYEFPRGLVLADVKLFRDGAREDLFAEFSDIGVNVDFVGLAKSGGTAQSAEISMQDSSITLYEGGESVATLGEVSGEIFVGEESIEIERVSALLDGLQIQVRGSLASATEGVADAADAGAADPAGEGSTESLSLDLTPFRALAPWLAFETEGAPPVLDLVVTGTGARGDSSGVSYEANLRGDTFQWRGIPIASVSAVSRGELDGESVEIPTFQMGYGDGFLSGVFSIDRATSLLTVERGLSSIDLISFLTALDSSYSEKFQSIEFVDAPTIQFTGTVPLETAADAKLDLSYEHHRGLLYKSGDRSLPIQNLRGRVTYSGGAIETQSFAADVLDGIVEINGMVRVTAEDKPFSGLIEISRLPLTNLSKYLGDDELGMTGDLYLSFRGVGYSDVSRIRGGGSLRIDEASLAAFPVVGPVQEMLGGIVPAFGIRESGAVTAAYIIESGVLVTNDLTVRNAGANLLVNGNMNLKTKQVDFKAMASLNETLATATGMQEKTIEVRGTGPVTAPVLTLRDFPVEYASEKLSAVLGTSPETLTALEAVVSHDPAAVERITSQLEEATGLDLGDATTDLLEGLGSLLAPAEEPASAAPVAPQIVAEPVAPE